MPPYAGNPSAAFKDPDWRETTPVSLNVLSLKNKYTN